jgi:hypothetical protein
MSFSTSISFISSWKIRKIAHSLRSGFINDDLAGDLPVFDDGLCHFPDSSMKVYNSILKGVFSYPSVGIATQIDGQGCINFTLISSN